MKKPAKKKVASKAPAKKVVKITAAQKAGVKVTAAQAKLTTQATKLPPYLLTRCPYTTIYHGGSEPD